MKRKSWNKIILPEKDICKEYISGKSIYWISDKYNCNSTTPILRVLKENNIHMRKGGAWGFEPPNKKKLPSKEICDLYIEGYSVNYIKKKFKCSQAPIIRILKENNIRFRSPGETFSLGSKIGYISSWNRNKKDCYNCSTIKKMSTSQKKRFETERPHNLGKKASLESINKRTQTRIMNNGGEYCILTPESRALMVKNNCRYWKNKKRDKKTIDKIKEARKNQSPVYTTSIEIKIQNFLKRLGIEYRPHKYINEIKHSYQCDIFIPSKNLIIEADGNYWHHYPMGKEIDHIRTKELIDNGFNVLRLWEHEINAMTVEQFQERIK